MNPVEKPRCHWVEGKKERYLRYHDEEWGVPVHDDRKLFEMLLLEGFQAGLTWECILNKRENFARAFDQFDFEKIRHYSEEKLLSLQTDPGIVRNRLKIRAAPNNAQVFCAIRAEFGSFDRYLWGWTGGKVLREVGLARSALSDKIAADLKKRGMRFAGSTIIYSYLQAVGVINAHEDGCFRASQL